MYDYLFYFFYSYYDRTEKWKEAKVPFLSSVLVISVLLMFNFLFIRDFITYHLNGYKYQYFKKNNRFKKILNDYKNLSDKRNQKFYWAWAYMILSVLLVILMGYSVRNNIRWI